MAKMRASRQMILQRRLDEQRLWMQSCGGNLEGYIQRYGTTENPKQGDGGELIYKADLAALHNIERALGLRQ